MKKCREGYKWVLNESGTKFIEEKIPDINKIKKDIQTGVSYGIFKANERFNKIIEEGIKMDEELRRINANCDPIDDILKEARKNTEKGFLKAYKVDDMENALQHLRCYRIFTKLLNREPLSMFDF